MSPEPEVRAKIEARLAEARQELELATRLSTATPQQVEAWIETNVTNISTAKGVLKQLSRIMIMLLKLQNLRD